MLRILLAALLIISVSIFASPIVALALTYWPAIIAIIPISIVMGPTVLTRITPLVVMPQSMVSGDGYLFHLPPQMVRIMWRKEKW